MTFAVPMRPFGVAFAAMLCATGAISAAAEDFYKGKTINLLISSGAGGGYDLYARMLARHIDRFIPGKPSIVAQNMPGAGGMKLLNHAYNVAKQDGTVVFTLHQNLPMFQRMGARGVKYDARKIQGIGRLSAGNELLLASNKAGIKSYKDMYTKEIIVGSTGASSNSTVYPYLARNMLGLKFKVISGYKSGTEVQLAMERGELQGMGSWSLGSMYVSGPKYLKPGMLVPIVQFGPKREKEWPDAPTVLELAKTPEDKAALEVVVQGPEIGRSYWVGPKVPKAQVGIVRAAFNAMVKDAKFLEEFKRQKMLERFATGEEMDAVVRTIFAAPDTSIERLRQAMTKAGGGRCQDYSKGGVCAAPKKKAKKKKSEGSGAKEKSI
jgi:tripartite-type tricarboxylate transporter receptor subunit TctC